MALTITIEGKGVIANADLKVNDTGGTGTGDWLELGGGSIDTNPDVYLYGDTSMGNQYASKSGWSYFDLGAGNELDFDVAGTEEGQFIYMWINISAKGAFDTLANKGFAIRLGTSLTDYREFLIAGKNDANGWTGGWKLFVIDPTKTGSVGDTGTFDVGAVRMIGTWIDTDVSVRADSIFFSQIAVGTGIRVIGTSTTGWSDIVSYCTDYANRAWGMVQEREGIYYVYGKIYIGDSTQSIVTSFADTAAPIIKFGISEYYISSAWTLSHPTDYGGLIIEDNASYTTTFDDGVIVGTDGGRSGSYLIGHDDLFVYADLYGGNATGSLTRLYGTTFRNFGGGVNMGDDAQHLFYGGIITGCAEFDPVGAPILRNVIFSDNTTTTGTDYALVWNPSIDISDCSFLANEWSILHDADGSATYTNLIFSGSTEYDILLTSTGTLTVSVDGGTIPTWSGVNGGTVSLPSSITLTMTVKDEAGDPIETAYAYIDDNNATPFIMNKTTNAQGVASETHTGGAAAGSTWRVRKYGYKAYRQIVDIAGDNISIPVTLIADPQQY